MNYIQNLLKYINGFDYLTVLIGALCIILALKITKAVTKTIVLTIIVGVVALFLFNRSFSIQMYNNLLSFIK